MALTNMADVHSRVVRIKPSTLFGNRCNHVTTIHLLVFNNRVISNLIKLLVASRPSHRLSSEPTVTTFYYAGERKEFSRNFLSLVLQMNKSLISWRNLC